MESTVRIFTLVFGLAIPLGPLRAAEACTEPVFVGAWNIQWLGNAKDGKRKAQLPEDVAGYIEASRVDVLALSEISATSGTPDKPRNAQLDETFATLSTSGARWDYLLFPKREGARAPHDQWTGLAWNTARFQLEGSPARLAISIDAEREQQIASELSPPEANTVIWSRTPYAVKLRAGKGNTDLLFVPIHMKSNIGGEATARARDYEASLLVDALKELRERESEKDIVVLGDSNMLSTNEPSARRLAELGLKDCNSRDIGTHISFKKGQKWAPFDRIFLAADQRETSASCPQRGNGSQPLDFKVLRPGDWVEGMKPSEFRNRLSDHMMVRTAICTGDDDD